CDVRRTCAVRRSFNQTDAAELGQCRRCDVLPRLARIPRDVDETVIGSGPDDVCIHWRRRNRENYCVGFDARLVECNRTAGWSERFRVMPCQITTDARPGLPAIARLPHML